MKYKVDGHKIVPVKRRAIRQGNLAPSVGRTVSRERVDGGRLPVMGKLDG